MSQFPPPPPSMPYATPPAPKQANVMGILSLVAGVPGMCVPGLGIVAIVLGALGMSKAKDPRVGGGGLAIAGLVLGIVGTFFSLLSLSILLPSLNKARETANRVKCQSNMSQIGKAFLLYSNENRGLMPPTLDLLVTTQELPIETFCCPSGTETHGKIATDANNPAHCSYVFVTQNQRAFITALSSDTVILHEKPGAHGGDGMNFLYADGHAEFHTQKNADQILADLAAKKMPPYPTPPPGMRNR